MTEYIIKVDEYKKDIDGGMPLQGKPQELVRCKDCKWWETGFCTSFDFRTDSDWFCADGEREQLAGTSDQSREADGASP